MGPEWGAEDPTTHNRDITKWAKSGPETASGTTNEGTQRVNSRNRQDHLEPVLHLHSKIATFFHTPNRKCLQWYLRE